MANRRLRRKFQKDLLVDVAMDLSTESAWRERLFSADLGKELLVSSETIGELSYPWIRAVQRHRLMFVASRVSAEGIDPWISGNGRAAVFAFWPKEFPNLQVHTGNPYPGSPEERSVQAAFRKRFPHGIGRHLEN